MLKYFQKYFKLNIWWALIIISCLYSLSLVIEFQFIFTDEYYRSSFSKIYPHEYIEGIIIRERESEWINFLFVPGVILIPSILIAFVINLIAILKDINLKFGEILDISIKSSIVFALNYFISTILKAFGLLNKEIWNIDNNYDYQSLAILFKDSGYPDYILYPLQLVNVSEIVFILFLSYGFSCISKMKYAKSLSFIFIIYFLILVFWVVFSLFLQRIIEN